jgi:Clr5 domain
MPTLQSKNVRRRYKDGENQTDNSTQKRGATLHPRSFMSSTGDIPQNPPSMGVMEGPTKADWEQMRPIITDLYLRHPLKDVRKVLEERHGFRGT